VSAEAGGEGSVEGDIIHKLGIFVEPINPENAGKYGVKAKDCARSINTIQPFN